MSDELKDNLDDKVKEIKKELWIEFERQDRWIGRHINILLVVIALIGGGSIYTYFQIQGFIQREVQRKVTQRMDEELKKENVQKLMMTSAETAVKGRVEEVITKKIDETVKPFATEIKAMTKTAKDDIENVKDFNALVSAAEYGSQKANDKLCEIAKGKSQYKDLALKQLTILQNGLKDKYMSPPVIHYKMSASKNGKGYIPLENLSTKEIFMLMERPETPDQNRESMMSYILNKPVNEILNESIRVLKNSDSIFAVAATCGILREKFGDKAEFGDNKGWIKFCEKELNKSPRK